MIEEAVVCAEVKTSRSSFAWSEDAKVETARINKLTRIITASSACPLLNIAPTLKGFKAVSSWFVYFTSIEERDQFQGSRNFAHTLPLGKTIRIGPP